jgi:hypothetical protein
VGNYLKYVILQDMSEVVNCKGYCFWRSGIDEVERYREIRKVGELTKWFNLSECFDPYKIIAVGLGSRHDSLPRKINQKVVHMVYPDGGSLYSQRANNNYDVSQINLRQLTDEYISELNNNYFLYLSLR